MSKSTHGSLYPRPMKIHTDHFSETLAKRSITLNEPCMTFDPTYDDVSCATLPKDQCVQLPW